MALDQLRVDRERIDTRHRDQVDQLLNEKNQINQRLMDTTEKYNASESTRAQEQKTIAATNERMAQLKLDYQDQISSLQKNVMDKSDEKDRQAQKMKESHDKQIKDLNQEMKQFKKESSEKVNDLESQIKQKQSNLDQLQSAHDSLKNEMDASRGELDDHATNLKKELESQKIAHGQELKSNQDLIERLESQLKDSRSQSESAGEELLDHKSQIENLTRQLALASMQSSSSSSNEDELRELQDQNEQLTKQLNELKKKNKKSEKAMEKNQQEHDALLNRVEELQDELTQVKKNSSASPPPTDTNKVNQLMDQLDHIQQLETHRYLIEHAILFADPTLYVSNSSVPEPTPVLYKALSSSSTHRSIPHHIVQAIEYMIERHSDHLPTESFWINCNTRLLSCLKQAHGNYISNAFQSNLKNVLDLMHANNKRSRQSNAQIPSIITATVHDDRQGDDDGQVDIQQVLNELVKITMNAYYHLLDSIVKKLDPLIIVSILDHQDENTRAKSAEGGAHMREMLRVLDSFEKQLSANKLDARLQDFLFRTIALYIDATVFNELLRDTNNTSRYLQIKMGVQIVENWYEQHARLSEFKYSRQSADVCAIAQDVLLKDSDMKSAVCPDLSKDQIAYLLANLKDEFSKSRTTNVQAPNTDVRLLFVSPMVKLCDDKDHPLLDFDAEGNDKIKSAKISEKYTKRQGLEFLK
ncbi:unconventional myosin [Acrasis kona]|uniref:Unconventional myosin n=1 Tax=Acrasis kona TaxID=1008807 RepID=A0AAW2ZHF8_9EUKA